jgi:ribosome-associated toxin RatA of RatAB toxin-antitoxin module
MDNEGLPWCSPKRKSDKYAKNGEEMMDILVDDIDRYEQFLIWLENFFDFLVRQCCFY